MLLSKPLSHTASFPTGHPPPGPGVSFETGLKIPAAGSGSHFGSVTSWQEGSGPLGGLMDATGTVSARRSSGMAAAPAHVPPQIASSRVGTSMYGLLQTEAVPAAKLSGLLRRGESDGQPISRKSQVGRTA